jgi:hypothetical protein
MFFPKALYRAHAHIEQTAGKLKRPKRIALRCEKTVRNFAFPFTLSLGFILTKSVRRPKQLIDGGRPCASSSHHHSRISESTALQQSES